MKSIYIAGPMTGYKHFNFENFLRVASDFREAGWDVLNPADHDMSQGFNPIDDDLTGHESLAEFNLDLNDMIKWDIEAVMKCDSVYMLKGWEKSIGSKAEHAVAIWCNKNVEYE